MKALEAQHPGYSHRTLETLFRSVLFPSSFFDHKAPVRGICFVGDISAIESAKSFANRHLGLGTVTLRTANLTPVTWKQTIRSIIGSGIETMNMGIILSELDRADKDLQARIAEAINASADLLWFITASDYRRLIAALRLPLIIYAGVAANDRMRFILQDRQQILIDEGSLKRKGK